MYNPNFEEMTKTRRMIGEIAMSGNVVIIMPNGNIYEYEPDNKGTLTTKEVARLLGRETWVELSVLSSFWFEALLGSKKPEHGKVNAWASVIMGTPIYGIALVCDSRIIKG